MKRTHALLALTAAILIPPADAPAQERTGATKEAPRTSPAEDGPALIRGRTIDAWVAALKDRDPAVRKQAVEVVGQRAVDPDVSADERSRLQTVIVSLRLDKN